MGQQVEAVGAAERVGVLRTGIGGDAFRLCCIAGILRREEDLVQFLEEPELHIVPTVDPATGVRCGVGSAACCGKNRVDTERYQVGTVT